MYEFLPYEKGNGHKRVVSYNKDDPGGNFRMIWVHCTAPILHTSRVALLFTPKHPYIRAQIRRADWPKLKRMSATEAAQWLCDNYKMVTATGGRSFAPRI